MNDLAIAAFFALCWAVVLTGLHFSWLHALVLTGTMVVAACAAGWWFVVKPKGQP